MSDDVTRYTMSVEFDADNVVDPWYAVPEKDSLGSWVRHSDYEALRQRCEWLEAERKTLQRILDREDMDELKEPTDGQ